MLTNVQRIVAGAPIRFVLWDGFALGPPQAVATVVLKNRRALLSWLWDAELNFGETYMSGAMEVDGSLPALLDAIYRYMPESARRSGWRSETHDVRASRDNVHAHYDLGSDFYRLWLDEQMLYTCAYFPNPDMTLEEAQVAKMDPRLSQVVVAAGRTCRRCRVRLGRPPFTWRGTTARECWRATSPASRSPRRARARRRRGWPGGWTSSRRITAT